MGGASAPGRISPDSRHRTNPDAPGRAPVAGRSTAVRTDPHVALMAEHPPDYDHASAIEEGGVVVAHGADWPVRAEHFIGAV